MTAEQQSHSLLDEARSALEQTLPYAVSAHGASLIRRDDAINALIPILARAEEDTALLRLELDDARLHATAAEHAVRLLRSDPAPPRPRRWWSRRAR